MGILIPLLLIFFCCLIIWRACDGFEYASEYIGRHMSEGVRGSTINAISSSLPELFTTLIALFVLRDQDGFAIGIGTTAGSALFNGMIIPALCILMVTGAAIKTVDVSSKVIWRDGAALILAQILLVVILTSHSLVWWQGLLLMVFYLIYLWYMIGSMKKLSPEEKLNSPDDEEEEDSDDTRSPIASFFYYLSLGRLLDLEHFFICDNARAKIKSETWNGWPLLLTSAGVIGIACWMLVLACEWLGTGPANTLHPSYELFDYTFAGIGMPAMFVAVIFAAMATSVPDTIISLRDARDGDYDDAVANALGSNIFDICFALGFPLFLFTLIYGPIQMSAETIEQSGELRFILLGLTMISALAFLIGKKIKSPQGTKLIGLGRGNAYFLLSLYAVFLVYIIGRAYNAAWTQTVSASINSFLEILPQLN